MIVFRPEQIKAVCEAAINEYPDECCGILLGKRDSRGRKIVSDVCRADNAAEAKMRKKHFKILPGAVLDAELSAAEKNQEIIGFYHSHTDCGADASEEDAAFAIPGMSYPIVSVEEGQIAELLCWEKIWTGGREDFVKETIEITRQEEHRWQ